MYTLYCRIYQRILKFISSCLTWRQPQLIDGENCLHELVPLLQEKQVQRVFIVTDKGITSLGLLAPLCESMKNENIHYIIYDDVIPNPTIETIENAVKMYRDHHCEAIIAFGGGSPIDCAKAVGARIAKPKKTIQQMKGQLKIRKETPFLVAIPTTAGTGSEATLAAVVSNRDTQEKYAINDHALIPNVAVLDPVLTINLPPHITASTGMDALTHAVEAFIGKGNTNETTAYSRDAVQLIFENLNEAYSNGSNLVARQNMQKASYLAGLAFTRAYVGNVHAIAHQLGGFYSYPHGLANAIILPHVLEKYGETVHKPLAELAELIGIKQSYCTTEEKASAFIEEIKKLNTMMEIPSQVNCIVESDIPLMVKRALQEANPLYPVPQIFTRKDMTELFYKIKL
ncbi:iron-containing alcohol dehydrogenase [Alkalihalobacillus sp. LMS39]|uniref:iron-containing alcohol dehydrogenase n=1 Tax=Alkalihalobacillus sp. LMS39 TaxID=2924032 RepID=UPI001FB2D1FB|nr:iron-containing alcohol dehydrogenase [Alkalihalobacillus sp. LMS39]UOE95773.1 iron-containing alcohol dehydrogenase [Alkalihalobacillus sp. LMS39]